MKLLSEFLSWLAARGFVMQRLPRGGLRIDTERTRRRRELARSENQSGHNLTVQTTIDMARTQTWTGGG